MDLTSATGTRWNASMIESAKRAADNIGAVLNSLTASDSIKFLESTMCAFYYVLSRTISLLSRILMDTISSITVMKPAIHLNLFFVQSENALIKSHARHGLDLHLIVLEELRHSSWSASIAIDLVQRALKALSSPTMHNNNHTATAVSESREPLVSQNDVVLRPTDLDFIDVPLFTQDSRFDLDQWTGEE